MESRPDCIPCILDQVLRVAANVTHDEWLRKKVLLESMKLLGEADLSLPPAEILFDVVRGAGKLLGKQDCFEEDKSLFTKEALALVPKVQTLIEKSDDRLKTAALVAASSGVVNVMTRHPVNLEAAALCGPDAQFAVDDFEDFRSDLAAAKNVLYILGNAAETVFDRLFIEEMKRKSVTCVARQAPILFGATVQDAMEAKLDRVARITDPGSDLLGAPPELASSVFKETLSAADLIIAKGQSNFVTMVGAKFPPAYFVLRVRCTCVARELGVKKDELVFSKNTGE